MSATKKQTRQLKSPSTPPESLPAQDSASPPVSLLTRPLGLEGWVHLEPVVLAALASGDPLLLIGRHGTAKSFLLERLAESLGLEFRFYNASLVNYDDLVGIPVPDETQTSLRYISTPSSIWEAEVVFIDEISRARPELQNKLFPIIHERRVQGIRLEKLRYRWAAMNPPPDEESETEPVYHGAEPLDPALADRFAYLIEVPGWDTLTNDARKAVLLDQFRGRHEFPVPVPDLVAKTCRLLDVLTQNPPEKLAEYLIALAPLAAKAGHELSTRRITTLLRSILAIQAARTILAEAAGKPRPGWEDAAWLAFRHGLPGIAHGVKTDPSALLAAHRQAWNLCGLDASDPWRQILSVPDPVDRLAVAARLGAVIDPVDVAALLTSAFASQADKAARRALALVVYLALRDRQELPAIAVETIATEAREALQPSKASHQIYGNQLSTCREAASVCATLSNTTRDGHCRNLLQSLLPNGFRGRKPVEVQKFFNTLWKKFDLQ